MHHVALAFLILFFGVLVFIGQRRCRQTGKWGQKHRKGSQFRLEPGPLLSGRTAPGHRLS